MIPDMTMRSDDELRKNWGWLLALGLALLVLGLIALTLSFATTLATVLFLGMLLLISGGFEIGNAFHHHEKNDFWLHLFTGILDLMVGALLVAFPGAGAASITLVLALLFLVGGPVRAIVAVTSRLPNWGWAVASGVIDLVLGLLLLLSWPASSLWLLGTIVGIALLFRGVWWASYAISLHRPMTSLPKEGGSNGTDLSSGATGPSV